jgi:RimJ/RimL family protein N-acetyltransferase
LRYTIKLSWCFEILRLNRVQLKTRDTNRRSQAAIQKVGGVFEGILRKDRIMPDGEVRDTIVFSIIREDWPEARAALEAKLAPFI